MEDKAQGDVLALQQKEMEIEQLQASLTMHATCLQVNEDGSQHGRVGAAESVLFLGVGCPERPG